jgi:hypothetical protein
MRHEPDELEQWWRTFGQGTTARAVAYAATEVERAEERAAMLRSVRNLEMRRMASEGASVREVGRVARMTSPGSIHKILKGSK